MTVGELESLGVPTLIAALDVHSNRHHLTLLSPPRSLRP
jgi:hypothetical protein